jgi:hypothetical protein
MSDTEAPYLHSCRFNFMLKPEEARRLKQRADDFGVSKANVFRMALCPEVFDEPYVAQGRVEGLSPQRRSSTA